MSKGTNISDRTLSFGQEVSIAAGAGTTVAFPDSIDTGEGEGPWGEKIGADYGTAELVLVVAAGNRAPAGMDGITAKLEHSDDGSTWKTLMTLANPSVAMNALKAGDQLAKNTLPPFHKRYLRVSATATGTITTAGTVTARLQIGM